MKLVTVVIKPFKLEDVREALSSIGIQGLTVTEVKGFGRQKGHAELYRGAEYSVNFLPKVKIDVAIADDQLDEVIDVISKAAYTGKIGDGKIFVAELDWEELMDMIVLGQVERITARHGEVLQLRPKAANSKALTEAIGTHGESILTLPRGFYLKKNFTGALLARHFLLKT
jgi:nitrogen regulatory protein P-II 2